MADIISPYYPLLLRIDTPYSIGTGFYWPEAKLVVCNEYTVRDNRAVVVSGGGFSRQLVRVLFTDPLSDLAFLAVPQGIAPPALDLTIADLPEVGTSVVALGRPGDKSPKKAEGEIMNASAELHDINYFQHSAKLPPVHSGGLLLNEKGEWLGMTYLNEGLGSMDLLALPAHFIKEVLIQYQTSPGEIVSRCQKCQQIVGEDERKKGKCPHCGAKVVMPNEVEIYEPIGIPHTIERMLERIGRDVQLARRGPNQWEIHQGSACIQINYHEDSGLINGDAYLAQLPEQENESLYEFILQQNYLEDELTLSIKGGSILLSLLIYDRYLNVETGLQLFEHLFKRADDLDNELVERFGARWGTEE